MLHGDAVHASSGSCVLGLQASCCVGTCAEQAAGTAHDQQAGHSELALQEEAIRTHNSDALVVGVPPQDTAQGSEEGARQAAALCCGTALNACPPHAPACLRSLLMTSSIVGAMAAALLLARQRQTCMVPCLALHCAAQSLANSTR